MKREKLKPRDFLIPLLFSLVLPLFGCATRQSLLSDFSAYLRETPRPDTLKTSNRTTLLFLVDGLSVSILKAGLTSQNGLPTLEKFFLQGSGKFRLGRAVFPSLTFPNISSILTASPIDQHPILGNQIFTADGKHINFEKPWNQNLLNQSIRENAVFAALKNENQNSASLSYPFYPGATVHLAPDLKVGAAYMNHDYQYIDHKIIDSLERLLDRTSPERWPSFIFVHLIGIDSLAHEEGPASPKVVHYLRAMDSRLNNTFSRLKSAEKTGKDVVTFLTADHGFTEINGFYDLESTLNKIDPEIKVLNQHRLAVLSLPPQWDLKKRETLTRNLVLNAGVQFVLERLGNDVLIRSQESESVLRYQKGLCPKTDYRLSLHHKNLQTGYLCPEELDRTHVNSSMPFFYSNIASYFHSPQHPEVVVIPKNHISFSDGFLGDHGGLTSEEILVPILARNAWMESSENTIPTFEILKYLKQKPTPTLAAQSDPKIVSDAPPVFASHLSSQPSSTHIRQSLQIFIPTDYSSVQFEMSKIISRNTPVIELGWSQYWTSLLNSTFNYRIGFPDYSPRSRAAQRFSLIGGYRIDDRNTILLSPSLSQEFFLFHDRIEQHWIKSVEVGSRSRIFSLGLGDISFRSGLEILLPALTTRFAVDTGYSLNLGLALECPLRETDLLTALVRGGQFVQNTNTTERSGWKVELGVSYALSFKD